MPRRYLGLGKELLPRTFVGADVACPISATTAFLTFAVPANSVAVGDTFELESFAVGTTTPNVVLSMAVGASNPGTTQVWATTAVATSTSAQGLWFQGLLTVKSIGGSGTVMGGGLWRTNSTTFQTEGELSNTNATQVVDTTAPWFISARVTMTAASAITMKSGVLRKVT